MEVIYVRTHAERLLSRLWMLKSRAASRERLLMTSKSDETPEASMQAPRSTYFKNDIVCLFCLGTRPNFEDEKNGTSFCVDVCVVMETTQELLWQDDEKYIDGETGQRDPLPREWRQKEGLHLTFQENMRSCFQSIRWSPRCQSSPDSECHTWTLQLGVPGGAKWSGGPWALLKVVPPSGSVYDP